MLLTWQVVCRSILVMTLQQVLVLPTFVGLALLAIGHSGVTSLRSVISVFQTAPAEPTVRLEDGSILYAELTKTLDAKKAKVGDPVNAVLLADVLAHGKIVARHDAKLLGHVTEAQVHSKETPESRLGIAFDKVILKGGQEIPFSAVLMALRPAPRLQVESMSSPAPPGTNPASSPQQEQRHYPMPKGPSVPQPASSRDPANRKDIDSIAHTTSNDMALSDIEGLSLDKAADGSNRVVVSLSQTVKLESGVRLELKTGTAKQ